MKRAKKRQASPTPREMADCRQFAVRRPSLIAAATDVLRREIAAGRWGERLPGERELVNLLKVSRPTLRSALRVLENEGRALRRPRVGWIVKETASRKNTSSFREIAILSPFSIEEVKQQAPFVLYWLDPLKDSLRKLGYNLNFHARPACFRASIKRALKDLVDGNKADCWLLYQSTPQMQHWFNGHDLRHIVLGTAFEKDCVSSIDFDQAAICRHAVVHLRKIGHRNIALISKKPVLAGDIESHEIFCQACADSGGEGHAVVENHDGSVKKVVMATDRVLDRVPRPTAILSIGVQETITTFTRIMERGLSIPRDISIISRDYHPTLSYLTPALACYMRNQNLFANRLLLLIQSVLSHAPGDYHNEVKLYADFMDGRSVAPLPKADGDWS